jgi:hypothetical protein
VIEYRTATGFVVGEGRSRIIHQHPGDISAVFEREDLTTAITRSDSGALLKVVCACREMDGASPSRLSAPFPQIASGRCRRPPATSCSLDRTSPCKN